MSIDSAFIDRLSAQSTLEELPRHGQTLDLSVRGQALADLLDADPELPGVVVVEGEEVRGVISRGQYLRLVGRQFGLEVYLPRQLRLMWDALEQDSEPLVLEHTTPIQDAAFRALERPRTLIYEPVIVSGGPGDLHLVDFPDLLRADSRLSQLRNRQMQQILATVQEGFLLVDPDHVVATEYSRSIEKIFETREIAGRALPELLAEVVGGERAELAGSFLETLFNRNVIEHLVQGINPLIRVACDLPGGRKHLGFRFVRSVEDGEIRRVLVRVEDVTRQVELAEEVEAEQKRAKERLDLVFDILRADASSLGSFLGSLDQLLENAGALLGPRGAAMPARDRLVALFRDLHGLKGEAGLLKLQLFARAIHKVEDRIVELRERPDLEAEETASLVRDLEPLRALVRETTSIVEQFRRLGAVVRPAATGSEWPAAVAPAAPSGSARPAPDLGEVRGSGREVARTNGFVAGVADLVADLAERLGKPARFHSHVALEEIPERYRDLVREALVQMVRNAMVHGVEAPEVRRERGKPPVATLQFAARRHVERGHLELIFQDDGGGLDLDAIRRKAREKGLEVDDAELPGLIFDSGFSTARRTSLDAGRGVGLDVVRTRVQELGGHLVPHFKTGIFCAFQVVLPL